MSGRNIVDLRRGRMGQAETEQAAGALDAPETDAAAPDPSAFADEVDPEPDDGEIIDVASHENLTGRLALLLPVLLAIGWTGFFLWLRITAPEPVDLRALPTLLGDYALPMIAFGVLYMLLARNSRVQSQRYADTAALLRQEAARLEQRMKRLAGDLAAARGEVAAQALAIEEMSAGSATQLKSVAQTLADSARSFGGSAGKAHEAGEALIRRLTAMGDSLPDLEDRAHRMAEGLQDSSTALDERLAGLETRIDAIRGQASEVRAQVTAANKSLTAQLNQLNEATRGAQEGLEGMAEIAVSRMDLAGERAAEILDDSRAALENQAAALEALVTKAKSEIAPLGRDAIGEFEAHAIQVRNWLTEIAAMTERHAHTTGELDAALSAQADATGVRLAALVEQGMAGNERLTQATARLSEDVDRMATSLAAGNGEAEALIGRAERLLTALDLGVRELDAAVPQALDRLDERVRRSQGLIGQATPEMEKLEAVADGMLGRVQEAADHLVRHQAALEALIGGTEAGLGATNLKLEDMRGELDGMDRATRAIAESAAPQLVEALSRIRDTAEKAADKAREALARAIADAASRLGETSGEMLRQAMAAQVTERLDALSAAARETAEAGERSVATLDAKIAELTAAGADMERRAAETQRSLEIAERESLARRSTLLIDALNSTAIDVAKLLSSDVTDVAWNAYLKGDRSAFTRKAVRLLDNGETRRIASLYQADEAFSEHVNRYIHDFEAMLRNILANRDGSALGVTLLSSDMGKLYVALAQGIERLRN